MGIFNRRRARPRDKPGAAPEGGLMFRGFRASDWYANRSEAICAAAARLSNTLASTPMHLYKKEQIQRDHSLEQLVRYSPAPGWNAFVFVRDMEFTRNTVGRAYAWILRDDLRKPLQMLYLDAGRVQTMRAQETGELWHMVALEDGRSGYIHDSDMIALSWLSTDGGVTPRSVLGGSLDYDAQIKEFSLKNLNGVHDVILLQTPGNLNGPKKDKLIEEILANYQASGKKALVLDSGVEAKLLSSSPVDPRVLDVEKVTKSRVAGVYGMQPHLLGDGENTSRNSEEEMQSFLTMSVVPAMAQWEAEYNKKLLSADMWKDGMAFRFDATDLTRANTAAMAEKHFKAVRGGWMRPNEVRMRDGLPPDVNGDELMMSRDLLPLWLLVNKPEMLLSSQRGKTNGEGENS